LQSHNRAVTRPRPNPAYQLHSPELPIQVVLYVMEHLHVDLSASAIAGRFSLKETVLLSAFESHTGIALEQFVLRRRIERALNLLKNSTADDGDIATALGWRSASAFRTAFVNYLGLSPTEYRRSLPPKQEAASLGRRKRPSKSACLPRQASGGRAFRAFVV